MARGRRRANPTPGTAGFVYRRIAPTFPKNPIVPADAPGALTFEAPSASAAAVISRTQCR